ncbi:MAG: IclR family transcriptional regulator [Chloroflexota bacterium]|nr:IclR family transcriptional regulator [Chloroflexota bacterium]
MDHAFQHRHDPASGGSLQRALETKRYRLRVRLFHLGMIVSHRMDLREITLPHLRRLVDLTEETAALFVPDPLGPICVAVAQSRKAMRVFAQLGSRMPWNAGTSSKGILAYVPEAEQERTLALGNFKRHTDFTITNPGHIRELLNEIRRAGYHVGVRDFDEDATGISTPIFGDAGRIVGAVGVTAPALPLTEAEFRRSISLVLEVTATISRDLGDRPAPEIGPSQPSVPLGRFRHHAAAGSVGASLPAEGMSPGSERSRSTHLAATDQCRSGFRGADTVGNCAGMSDPLCQAHPGTRDVGGPKCSPGHGGPVDIVSAPGGPTFDAVAAPHPGRRPQTSPARHGLKIWREFGSMVEPNRGVTSGRVCRRTWTDFPDPVATL